MEFDDQELDNFLRIQEIENAMSQEELYQSSVREADLFRNVIDVANGIGISIPDEVLEIEEKLSDGSTNSEDVFQRFDFEGELDANTYTFFMLVTSKGQIDLMPAEKDYESYVEDRNKLLVWVIADETTDSEEKIKYIELINTILEAQVTPIELPENDNSENITDWLTTTNQQILRDLEQPGPDQKLYIQVNNLKETIVALCGEHDDTRSLATMIGFGVMKIKGKYDRLFPIEDLLLLMTRAVIADKDSPELSESEELYLNSTNFEAETYDKINDLQDFYLINNVYEMAKNMNISPDRVRLFALQMISEMD